ncbi:MAG: threonine/homoserine/homoserine lactone efflux protein [Flavobacteriaceae bacterium]|jgi:threonine/homoserine/homoserine lactone efflux protein|uniref:LysE family translocator n=1 Tax=Candidatus Marifrigoribacter sp. Uisw_064 TaxID=3230970 RepID=UPI003AEB509A
MLENILSFSLATIVLALSPGPDNIYVLSQSLTNGVKSGLATTAGLITGCILHTTLLAFGLSAVITASPAIFYGIKIFGAVYLFYLAFKVYRSDSKISLGSNVTKKSHKKLFSQGVIMNILNPKVMIFFLAFFPGFLWDKEGDTVFQFYVLGIVFMFVSFIVFGLIAVLAGKISNYLKSHKAVGSILKWLQIIVFIGIAVYILIP